MSKGWAVVTGAAKGLGREIAFECARLGYNVVLQASKSFEEASKVQSICQSIGVQAKVLGCDLSNIGQRDQFCDECLALSGGVSLLINNAGVYFWGLSSITDERQALLMFETNCLAPIHLSRRLLNSIKKHEGSIINIGSAGVGYLYADLHAPIYHASKAALLMLTRSLAKEVALDKVRVNMISPGKMENSVDLEDKGASLPLKRAASFDEIISVLHFLLRVDNRYITGQNIEIAGGFRLL